MNGVAEARYINSVLRINEGQLQSFNRGAAIEYSGYGLNLEYLVEQATNGVVEPARHVTNTFSVPQVGITERARLEFSLVSNPAAFNPDDIRVMLIAPSGNADCLNLSDELAGTSEGTLGGTDGGQRTEVMDAPEEISPGDTLDFTVAVLNTAGQIDSNQNSGSITVSVQGSGQLTGNLSATIQNGVASFANLTCTGGFPGDIIRIRARADGLNISPDAFSPEIGVISPSIQVTRYILPMSDTMIGEPMNGVWRVVMWDISEDGNTTLLADLRLNLEGSEIQ